MLDRRASGRGRVAGKRALYSPQFLALFTEGSRLFDAGFMSGNDLVDRVNTSRKLVRISGATGPVSNANFLGKPTISFNGGQWYDSNEAPGAWKAHHTGTGADAVAVFASNDNAAASYVICADRPVAAFNEIGFAMRFQPTAGMRGMIGDGIGGTLGTTVYDSGAPSSGALTSGQPTFQRFTYKESVSPECALYHKSVLASSGPSNVPPVASDPPSTLRLGQATGVGGTVMVFRALYTFDYVLSAAQWTIVKSAIAADCGAV